MAFFVYKLLGPRPTFPADITEDERVLMYSHAVYWTDVMNKQGSVVAFGPVADPRGTYGIAILEVADQAEAERLIAGDPAQQTNVGFGSECHPMLRAHIRR
jgi:uncharacterized protein YciI